MYSSPMLKSTFYLLSWHVNQNHLELLKRLSIVYK